MWWRDSPEEEHGRQTIMHEMLCKERKKEKGNIPVGQRPTLIRSMMIPAGDCQRSDRRSV